MSYGTSYGINHSLAKCCNCGAVIEVDNDNKMSECPACGSAFPNEIAITLFSINQRRLSNDFVIEDGVLKQYCGEFVNVVIPDSVNEIYAEAFSSFRTYLNSVTLPKNLKRIEEGTFKNCVNLYNVEFNNHLESIGKRAFSGCAYLNHVNIPNSVSLIEESAFDYCESLTDISFPNSIKEIKASTFKCCSSLVSFTFPSNLEVISEEAFYGCKSLKDINFPDSLVELGSKSFANCLSIEKLTIPASFCKGQEEIFKGCSSLKSVTYDYAGRAHSILPHMFEDCTSLVDIDMKDELEGVLECGLNNCSALKSIKLSQNFKTLEKDAFRGCAKLESIEIPSNSQIETIPESAFADCTSLVSISLSRSIKTIESNAFRGCMKLGVVNIPNDSRLESMPESTFADCKSLTSINLPQNLKRIEKDAFKNCCSLSTINLPQSLKIIESNAFRGCSNLEEVHIPDNTMIDTNSFSETPKLRLFLPNSIDNLKRLAVAAEKNGIVLLNTANEMLIKNRKHVVPILNNYSKDSCYCYIRDDSPHSLLAENLMEKYRNTGNVTLILVRTFVIDKKHGFDFMSYDDFAKYCIGFGDNGIYENVSNYQGFSYDLSNDYSKLQSFFGLTGIKNWVVDCIEAPIIAMASGSAFSAGKVKTGSRRFVRVQFPFENSSEV